MQFCVHFVSSHLDDGHAIVELNEKMCYVQEP